MTDTETIAILRPDGRPTGETVSRERAHAEGLWHGVVHVWLLNPAGSVIVQRRARGKDLAPGLLDVSVGGHLRPGETWLHGLREAEEELGVELGVADVDHLGRFPIEHHYADGRVDREYQDELVAMVDRPLRAYALACDEVQVIYEVPLARAVALWRDGASVAVAGWDCQHRVNDALLVVDDVIAPARAATVAALERLEAWWVSRSAT